MSFTLPALKSEWKIRGAIGAVNAPEGPSVGLPPISRNGACGAEKSTSHDLTVRLHALQREESAFFAQRLLDRCAAVERSARQDIECAWSSVIVPSLVEASDQIFFGRLREVLREEASVRAALAAAAERQFLLHHEQSHLEEEEHHLRAVLCALAIGSIQANRISCPWGRDETHTDVGQRSSNVGCFGTANAVAEASSDGAWVARAEPGDEVMIAGHLGALPLLQGLPLEIIEKRTTLAENVARLTSTQVVNEAALREHVAHAFYSRERAALMYDEETRLDLGVRTIPCCLPGLVLPWTFVEAERNERLDVMQAYERHALYIEAIIELFQKVVHTESSSRQRLCALHYWVDERRLNGTLLIQRAWRYFAMHSPSQRRRDAIRRALPWAHHKRRSEETSQVLVERMELIEDATLRDVWAESCTTGELGLFYPYRKQVLEVAVERHHRKLYHLFVQSLAQAVRMFVQRSHADVAREMRRMFKDEVERRETCLREEQRHFQAAKVMMDNTLRMILRDPDDAPVVPPSVLGVAMLDSWQRIYEDDQRSEWRRVALCANGWRHFRLERHKLVYDIEESDAYTAIVSQRTASASARPPSSERIPSAGYRRLSSSSTHPRVISSGGYDRIGSGGRPRRIGSASQSTLRRGSSADSRVAKPRPPPNPAPRFWEGFERVIHAKQLLQDQETSCRLQITEAFQLHVEAACAYWSTLRRHPEEFSLVVPDTFASKIWELVQCEMHVRHLLQQDVDAQDAMYQQFAAALAMSAHLSKVESPRVAEEREEECRRVVEHDQQRQWNALATHLSNIDHVLRTATEHLRRTGLIPRPAGRNGQTQLRASSALQRDDLQHRRSNFVSAATVATVIQRWWRLFHFKPYRVAEAGKDILQRQKHSSIADENETKAAHVLQSQWAALGDEQVLQRRTTSGSAAQLVRSSSARVSSSRPHSAFSNLQNSAIESMRTVLSRRSLQPGHFVHWAVVEQDEHASRLEWSLLESISRSRLQSLFVDVVMAAALLPKLKRIEERQEPASRLRIEREALHAFVSLFFCPEAEAIRSQSVFDSERRGRGSLRAEELLAWHAIESCTVVLSETIRQCTVSMDTKMTPLPTHQSAHQRLCDARGTVENARRRALVESTRRQTQCAPIECHISPMERIVLREDISRLGLLRGEETHCRALYASHLIAHRSSVADDLLNEWETSLWTKSETFDDAHTHIAGCFRICSMFKVCLAERHLRKSVVDDAFESYAHILTSMHGEYLEMLWREERRRWRHTHASMALSTTRLVSEELEVRLVHAASKLRELASLEENARRIVDVMEVMRRESDHLVGSSLSAVRESLRRTYYTK